MEGPSLASRYVGLSLRVYIYGGGVGVWVDVMEEKAQVAKQPRASLARGLAVVW